MNVGFLIIRISGEWRLSVSSTVGNGHTADLEFSQDRPLKYA